MDMGPLSKLRAMLRTLQKGAEFCLLARRHTILSGLILNLAIDMDSDAVINS